MNKLIAALAVLPLLAATAFAASPYACVDGLELDGRSFEVTLAPKDGSAPLVYTVAFDECHVEIPRDEPPAPDYARRLYKDGKTYLMIYTTVGAKDSRLALYLADGRSAYIDVSAANAELASGKPVDLGGALVVRGIDARGQGGSVTPVKASIKAVAPKP